MTKNAHKVPAKQWRRWNSDGRRVFNELYGAMMDDQTVFQHPKAGEVPAKHWATTAWNAAWVAADAASPDEAMEHIT